jgi:hypothetical protein
MGGKISAAENVMEESEGASASEDKLVVEVVC